MERCPHVTSCPLFTRFSLESNLKFWQAKYCDTEFVRCARYELSARSELVPLTLLPNGKTLDLSRGGRPGR
jgi:hypothetical protein